MFRTVSNLSPGDLSITSSPLYSEYASESSPDSSADNPAMAGTNNFNNVTPDVCIRSTTSSSTTSGTRQTPLVQYATVHSPHTPSGPFSAANYFPNGRLSTGQIKLSLYANSGLLTLHVICARNLTSGHGNVCDSYVKVWFIPDATKQTRCKTGVVFATNNPEYNEKFSFELLDEDFDKRLFISVWNRNDVHNSSSPNALSCGTGCEFLGCLSFSIRRVLSRRKYVKRYYYLLPADIGQHRHIPVSPRSKTAERQTVNKTAEKSPGGGATINDCHRSEQKTVEIRKLLIRRCRSADGGFGFSISTNSAGRVLVCRVDLDSHAYSVGLRVGDEILRIGDQDVTSLPVEQIASIVRRSMAYVTMDVRRQSRLPLTDINVAQRRTSGNFFPYPTVGAGPPMPSFRTSSCASHQELLCLEQSPRRRPLIQLQQQQQHPPRGKVDQNQPGSVCFRKSDPSRSSTRSLRPMSEVLTRSTSFTTTDYGWLDDVMISDSLRIGRAAPSAADAMHQVTRSLNDLRTKKNISASAGSLLPVEANVDQKRATSSLSTHNSASNADELRRNQLALQTIAETSELADQSRTADDEVFHDLPRVNELLTSGLNDDEQMTSLASGVCEKDVERYSSLIEIRTMTSPHCANAEPTFRASTLKPEVDLLKSESLNDHCKENGDRLGVDKPDADLESSRRLNGGDKSVSSKSVGLPTFKRSHFGRRSFSLPRLTTKLFARIRPTSSY